MGKKDKGGVAPSWLKPHGSKDPCSACEGSGQNQNGTCPSCSGFGY